MVLLHSSLGKGKPEDHSMVLDLYHLLDIPNESVVQPSKFSLQDVDYFLNIFTRRFRLKSERKNPETINNVNVIYVALVRIFFINKVIHALGLLTLLICFSRFFSVQ